MFLSILLGLYYLCWLLTIHAFNVNCKPFKTQCVVRSKIQSMDDSYNPLFNRGMYAEKILYHDDDIVVVDKPANVQTAPGYINKESLATTISTAHNISRVDQMVVHRLDYATSGVIVFAKNEQASKHLHNLFRTPNRVEKVYKSIVAGPFGETASGIVDLPIGRDNDRGPPFYKIKVDSTTARASKTHWEVIDAGNTASLVRLLPHTGR